MPAMRLLTPLVALGASLTPGCTLMVIDDVLSDRIACEQPGDCAAGFGCVDGSCQEVEAAVVPPPEGTVVGADGGEVLGPDGVVLTVPVGAIASDTELFISRESATHVARGCEEHSGFFRVSPEVQLASPAVLAIPVTDCAVCVVCAAPDDDQEAWLPLDEPSVAPAEAAAALVSRTGQVVVAGVAP